MAIVHSAHCAGLRSPTNRNKIPNIGAYSAVFPCARTSLWRRSEGSAEEPMFTPVPPRVSETPRPSTNRSNPSNAVSTIAACILDLPSLVWGSFYASQGAREITLINDYQQAENTDVFDRFTLQSMT